MDKIVKPGRLFIIFAVIAVLAVVYFVALYKLQIVEGAKYYDESVNSVVTTETVEAARGNILDRYGRVLVTNRACNNLVINVDDLLYNRSGDEANAVILELCGMVTDAGAEYTDELPITKAPPFEFTDMTDIQKARLKAWLAANNLSEGASAVDVMAAMRSRYKIDNSYTSEQTRIIAGVRYEINVRYLINTSQYIFAKDVSTDLIAKLMEHNIPGFTVQTSYVREYKTSYAAQLLGYIGLMNDDELASYVQKGYSPNAQVGKAGAELAFESYLHGTDGEARVTTTSTGVVTSTTYTTEPDPGGSVYLTLDGGLQESAENTLSSFITSTNTEREAKNAALGPNAKQSDDYQDLITGGSVVAVDVKTGEPLCIASWPTYDPATITQNYNELLAAENQPLYNRALMGTYAPGSTFKPCVAIAALNEGKITINTGITCLGVFKKYESMGYTPHCWIYDKTGGGHGTINVTKALTVSCNYFFYTLGDYLQIDLLDKYAKAFGLGESTGIELAENTGVMVSNAYMQKKEGRDLYVGDVLQAAIGQSDSLFTPMQLAEYCAAVANGGTRHTASILKAVRSYDSSETIFERSADVLSTVEADPANFKAVQDGMYGVANDPNNGTAYTVFQGAPYKAAAKTGTAETGDTTNNAAFMCYAPYDDPQIAVAVVIEKGGSGKAIGKVARAVLDYYYEFSNGSTAVEGENTLLK